MAERICADLGKISIDNKIVPGQAIWVHNDVFDSPRPASYIALSPHLHFRRSRRHRFPLGGNKKYETGVISSLENPSALDILSPDSNVR